MRGNLAQRLEDDPEVHDANFFPSPETNRSLASSNNLASPLAAVLRLLLCLPDFKTIY